MHRLFIVRELKRPAVYHICQKLISKLQDYRQEIANLKLEIERLKEELDRTAQ